ncbi:MAG TPA: TetR/AcrR family transcriptional regulator [Candidatus Goldiibacteriota bacterium]|jgi:TetR/AcrR family transcriptional regulator|nr:TetR/AcrR family transcriptional regulator [Candidatus Goldiibacteriota bacterium]HPI03298.1 TetR/AcrR family transcriptional regulator [Candidatus Goldiibacteriota bacterium]HPN65047.1 TetR/AcrR family transcriptional regulator [Candidatus Goldiibacteriota bacterium]HRQ42763.1 TetR/AcrR family transcriptional regulator [Candidatus Goldiibacteriota bacterium]
MDNKENIIKKATEIFAKLGYEGAGIQQIVDAAGITKPTMYHYFGSKKGLFEEIVSINNTELLKRLEEACRYERDIIKNINQVIGAYFKFASAYKDYYRMMLSSWFYPADSEIFGIVKNANNAQYELVKEMFLRAVPEHGNMRGRHEAYAFSLIGTINSYIGVYYGGSITLNEQEIHRLSGQFMHGIFS